MKLKRAKAYRKLMHQYEIQFGFREAYQVLLDAEILQDAWKFKIDLVPRLEGVLAGKIKPMITQCSIRHLYNAKPKNDALIEQAKTYERRRCNHHELEHPFSSLECLSAVVGPTNKHRYIVASQDQEVRAHMRTIAGLPLVYISKSVMLLEPMNTQTAEQRSALERSKFRLGLKGQRNPEVGQKRKREGDAEGADASIENSAGDKPQKKKRQKGPKQPNPLSMKKSTKAPPKDGVSKPETAEPKEPKPSTTDAPEVSVPDGETGPRKRKRKHKPKSDGDSVAPDVETMAS
jgi:U3 small nucleolar RNA-associated protein 23